jgi:hypothetical protein
VGRVLQSKGYLSSETSFLSQLQCSERNSTFGHAGAHTPDLVCSGSPSLLIPDANHEDRIRNKESNAGHVDINC